MTVAEVLVELRAKKPEAAELYNMFVTEANDELIGTFNLTRSCCFRARCECKSDNEIRTGLPV